MWAERSHSLVRFILRTTLLLLAMSAFACAAIAVRSYHRGYSIDGRSTPNLFISAEATRGWLCIKVMHFENPRWTSAVPSYGCWQAGPSWFQGYAPASYNRLVGDENGAPIEGSSVSRQCVFLPAAAVLLGVAPMLAYLRGPVLRRRRRSQGLCEHVDTI